MDSTEYQSGAKQGLLPFSLNIKRQLLGERGEEKTASFPDSINKRCNTMHNESHL
jgi:hypothetical protein